MLQITRESCHEEKLHNMTFVAALFSPDEIVVAADTRGYDSEHHLFLKPCHKIKRLGPHVFSSSGSSAGFDIYNYLDAQGIILPSEIDVAATEYYKATNDAYRDRRYSGDQRATILMGGFGKHGAQVYRWNLPSQEALTSTPDGRAFIGASESSPTFFPRFLHDERMMTPQRIQLAYFCAARVAEIDPRVGKPIDIAVLTRNGLKEYTEAELEPFIRQDGVIWGQTKQLFLGDLMLSVSN